MPSDHPLLRFLNPATLAPPAGYSHVAEVTGGRILFLSGQVPVDRSGVLVAPGDLAGQTRQVFANLKAALEAAGTDFAHVAKLTFYLTDASGIAAVRAVRDEFVDLRHPPASTAVEVRRLVREEFLLEVDAVAAAPSA